MPFVRTILLIALAASILGGGFAVSLLSRFVLIPLVTREARAVGVSIDALTFGGASAKSSTSFGWTGVAIRGSWKTGSGHAFRLWGDIEEVNLRLAGLLPPHLSIDLRRARLSIKSDSNGPPSGEVWHRSVRAVDLKLHSLVGRVPFDVFRPAHGLRELFRHFASGDIPNTIVTDGEMNFSAGERTISLRFGMEESGSKRSLRLNADDLKRVAPFLYTELLTDSEVELVAAYPFRSEGLLRIKEYAEQSAHSVHAKYPHISEDAYRHVLWSYLLSRDYGEEFAKRVTDAHEIGEASDHDSLRDHEMDRHNNEIGREYARKQITEEQLLKRFVGDQKVIREPGASPFKVKLAPLRPKRAEPMKVGPMDPRRPSW